MAEMSIDAVHEMWTENFVRVWGAYSIMEENRFPMESLKEIEQTIEKLEVLVTVLFNELKV